MDDTHMYVLGCMVWIAFPPTCAAVREDLEDALADNTKIEAALKKVEEASDELDEDIRQRQEENDFMEQDIAEMEKEIDSVRLSIEVSAI